MRTIDKIKDLIVKLGGTPSEKPRVNDQLDKLCGCSLGAKSWDELTGKPFGVTTEMVEILPEQSVTGEEQNGLYLVSDSDVFVLSKDKKYMVVLNGKTYERVAETSHIGDNDNDTVIVGNKDMLNGNLDDTNMPFILTCLEKNTGGIGNEIAWFADLGETITLAIYEEQEVVKKLDPKFGGTVTLYTVNWDREYIFKDKNGNEKLTQAELLSIVNSGANIVFIYIDVDKPLWYSNHVYITVSSLTGEVDFNVVRGNGNTDTYYTAEQSGGPM